jgi:hypothetical protein
MITIQGGILRKWKIPITGFYYGLLRILRILRSYITDITGLFLRIFLTLNQNPEKAPKTLIFEKNPGKSSRFITDITEYYGYYGNRYYRMLKKLRSVISPPPCNIHSSKAVGSLGVKVWRCSPGGMGQSF